MSDKNTAITETGLGRMLDQFKGSLKLRELAAAFLDQVQAFEDAAHPILAERGIDNATGDRLDGLGAIFGVPRGGRDDDTYRKALKAELLVLQSKGTPEEILTIAQALIEMPVADYDFLEYFPKTIYLRPVDFEYQYPGLVDISPVAVGTALRRAVAAATEVLFVYSLVDDAATFRFATEGAVSEFASAGFASVPPASIGTWLYDNTSTTSAGLLSGGYRFNALSYADATELYVHDNDSTIVDKSADLAALLNDTLILETGNPAWIAMTVTSVTNNGSFYTLGVGVADTLGTMSLNQLTEFHAYINNGGRLAGVA